MGRVCIENSIKFIIFDDDDDEDNLDKADDYGTHLATAL